MFKSILQHLTGSKVPAGMVPNSENYPVFAVDHWGQLDRFLVLGSEGGSYYATERALTLDNIKATRAAIAQDGVRAVERIVAISDSGRAPKNDPAILALALAASSESLETRQAALAALPRVCRTGTHLFHFAAAIDGQRGWGRALRRAVANWYLTMPIERLALQAVKYKARDGWSHRDMLRLSHPKAGEDDAARKAVFDWICGRRVMEDALPRLVQAHDQAAKLDDVAGVTALIREAGLPREAIPTQFMSERDIWDALLVDMPITALIRTLNRMTTVGLITPMSDAATHVAARITDVQALTRGRVHPMALLLAQTTYASGRGILGKGTWEPVSTVVDALDTAFYQAFEAVEPTGKRIMLALDVSGSMGALIGGTHLSCAAASAAMALVTMATEPKTHVVGFTSKGGDTWSGNGKSQWLGGSNSISTLAISPKQRLDDVVRSISGLPFGGTDCSLPMLYALEKGIKADAFVVYTDSETWAGEMSPIDALKLYRAKTGIPAKLVVVGMTSNGFSIADPTDSGMLDVVGFDAAAPAIIADFIRG
jgi:60 kDa SS-A/Ro ribonucleoprotein